MCNGLKFSWSVVRYAVTTRESTIPIAILSILYYFAQSLTSRTSRRACS
jgi:hypothetical protein